MIDKIREIVKEELNIKELNFKPTSEPGNYPEVTLDTNQTPELEAEGYAREISRKIQAARKKNESNKI